MLSNLNNDPNATQIQMLDLKRTLQPLGFDFPFYEQIFDQVHVTYTGVLNFQSSVNGAHFCCNGRDITNATTQSNGNWDYSIFGLWTDLDIEYAANPWFKGSSDKAIFGWYNVPEWYRRLSDVSSFEIELHNTGEIQFKYDEVDVVNHSVTIGVAGDMSEGQYYQFEYRAGGMTETTPFTLSFNTQTGIAVDADGVVSQHAAFPAISIDPCEQDPLSCGLFTSNVTTAITNFNVGPEVFGDDITDFIDDPSLNFGPDPFETYDQTLLPMGAGSEEFFESSFENFDQGMPPMTVCLLYTSPSPRDS